MKDLMREELGAPKIVDRSTFQTELYALLVREKAHTRRPRSTSRNMGNEKGILPSRRIAESSTRFCGSRTVRLRRRSALIRVKIAVFAPIPSASERTATT